MLNARGRECNSYAGELSRTTLIRLSFHHGAASYTLAETLNSQLDDLSQNLSSMITEVNTLSGNSTSTVSRQVSTTDASPSSLDALKTGGRSHAPSAQEADPISQIVAILNAHLSSLRWIDQSATDLREKVDGLRRGRIGEPTGRGPSVGASSRYASPAVGASRAGSAASGFRREGSAFNTSGRGYGY